MAITDILGGAQAIGRSLIRPTRAVDVVGITGGGFAPLFSAARPLRAEVVETAALMEHPLETGSLIADHIVFDPIEIEIPSIIVGESEYRNTYALIKAAFTAGTLLTVVTRTGSYPNMVLSEIPHEERPEAFDAIAMRIRLREAHFITPQSGSMNPKDPNQSSTVKRGAQQTKGANGSQSGKAGTSYGQSGAGGASNPAGSTLYQWYSGT